MAIEEALWRVMQAVARRLIDVQLSTGAPVDPRQIAAQSIETFADIVMLPDELDGLRARIESFAAEMLRRRAER